MHPYPNDQVPNTAGRAAPGHSSTEPAQRRNTQPIPAAPVSFPSSPASAATISSNIQPQRSQRQGILGKRPHSLRIGILPIENNEEQSPSQWDIPRQGSSAPTLASETSLPLYANEPEPQFRQLAEQLKAVEQGWQDKLQRFEGLKSENTRLTQRVTELELNLEDANVDLIAYKFGGTPPTSKEVEAFKATIKAHEDSNDQLEDKVKTLELQLSVHIGKGQLKRHREDCQDSQRKQTIYRARISGDCIDLTSPSTSPKPKSISGTIEDQGDKMEKDQGMEESEGRDEGILLEISSLAEKVYELVTPITGILRHSAEEHLDNAPLSDKTARMDSQAILYRCDQVDRCIAAAREGVAKLSKSSSG